MTVQIENEFLIATFAEEGAELVSLQNQKKPALNIFGKEILNFGPAMRPYFFRLSVV